jgi:hypothetical protein
LPDELAHHAESTGTRNNSGYYWYVAGHHTQQGRLAGAVWPDQSHLRPFAHAERDVGEEHTPVRQRVSDTGHVHVSHA